MDLSRRTLLFNCAAAALVRGAGELESAVSAMAKIGFCSAPTFSPDGNTIVFLSNMTGAPQLWSVASSGGWPKLLTAFDDPVGAPQWSPDGEWIAFTIAPGGGMNVQIYLMRPDGTGIRRLTDGGKETNSLGAWSDDGKWLAWSSNRKNPRGLDCYYYDVASRESTFVCENPGLGYIGDFSRDRSLATIWRMKSRGDNNVFVRELATGKEVLLTPHQGPGSFGGGMFSADGKTVYLTSNKDRDLIALARVPTEGGTLEIVAARPDAELADVSCTRDRKTAILAWNVGGRTELEWFDVPTGRRSPGPKLPAELAGAGTFSNDGKLLALTLSGSVAPANVYVFERSSGKLSRITDAPHAGVGLNALIRPELVAFKAHDGIQLSGWLYRPKGVSGPAPYVLSFHGGPEGQEVPGFRSDYQALLSRGIGVFAPNVRGSSGFGKKFVNLDNGPLRVNGVKDIQSCVNYLVENKTADPNRLGITGGSYGGYMVMAGITEYPEMFAAAANLFGVVNFETFFKHTEPWMAAISTVEYGDPATQAALLRQLSPIHKLDRVKTPTIVLHGANDTNVPVVEAEQVVESLKKRGVPVEYVLFADEGHGRRKTPNRIRSTVAIVQWFEKYLKNG